MDATFKRTNSDCTRQPFARLFVLSAVLAALALNAAVSDAANFRTRNFLVEAPRLNWLGRLVTRRSVSATNWQPTGPVRRFLRGRRLVLSASLRGPISLLRE